MTRLEPYLFLRRLVVESTQGEVAFDERFHAGLNIIRGNNSSGKSTLANFIFYVLGGDFQRWTPEAKACRTVYVETEMSGATLTLRRHVTELAQQPMDVFWGSYDEAQVAGFGGWKQYPYRQTQSRESFSSVLFAALGFPEVTTAEESQITMHQVLRLIYIDQDSPTRNLFRTERFDSAITRRTIAELLLGVYDDSLYLDRLALRLVQQEQAEKKQEFTAIKRIFSATGQEMDRERVQKSIVRAQKQLTVYESEIQNLRMKTVEARRNSQPHISKLNEDFSALKRQMNLLMHAIKQLELDIVDSEEFIETLNKKLKALDDSVATRKVLGNLSLEYCPLCLNPLSEVADDGHCSLCKQSLPSDSDKTFGKRLQQEIRQQIRESEKLLSAKRRKLESRSSELQPLRERLNLAQREIDLEEKQHLSTRDQRLDDMLIEKGKLENHLEVLGRQLVALEQLEILKEELESLASKITSLEHRIAIKQDREAENYLTAMREIKRIARLIVQRDLDYQDEFKTASEVEIDFANDSYSLDGENSFSASSLVYLKNAIRFAIFFAALSVPNFRYPRFILCDNTEDKGMEMDRSRNFQKVVAELSKSSDIFHQVILTTSMIEPTLNNSDYVIGDFYSLGHKSLKLALPSS